MSGMEQPVPREVQMSVKIHTDEVLGVYKMESLNRGVLLLVNIIDFPDPESKRSGAENDSESLKHLFEKIGFRVCSHDNLSQRGFFNVLGKLTSSSDVKETECFVLVLMSHGTRVKEIDKVMFNDGSMVDLQRIENHFRTDNCPNLVDKPKVLIFPFCRGGRLDMGVSRPGTSDRNSIEMESAGFTKTNVPTLADTIICYGNTAGFQTHRDLKSGNWYIQKFCDVMAKYAHNTHFENILKKTQAETGKLRGPKQSLQTGSFVNIGFNKKLYFNPGFYSDHIIMPAVQEVQMSVKIHTAGLVGVYKMESRNRGVLLLMSTTDFPDPQSKQLGADIDSVSLKYLFERMGFRVFIHDNLSQQGFFDVMDTLTSSSDVKETECFVLVGFTDGTDVDLKSIISRFQSADSPNLEGKPKVLFFPFSRDITSKDYFRDTHVPTLADILICYCNSPRFEALKHKELGNFFIQTFCDVMNNYAHNTHLDGILWITQTEMVKRRGYWGTTVDWLKIRFNKRLYFNPGFYRD